MFNFVSKRWSLPQMFKYVSLVKIFYKYFLLNLMNQEKYLLIFF